jgi:ribonuclease HI
VKTILIDTPTSALTNIDNNTSYKDIHTTIQPRQTTTILYTKPHNRKWDSKEIAYTAGSQVKGNNTLGAGVVNPRTHTITHIGINSQTEKHMINRAELAAITVALKPESTEGHLEILTESPFCINAIRNYAIDPTSYKYHLHKDLLHLTDQLLHAKDTKHLQTHIGKVKSHTDIEYNESADTAARAAVDGEVPPDITFDEVNPPIGGLRTWPQIRRTTPNNSDIILKITNLKTGLKKATKETTHNTKTKCTLLQAARVTGTDFSI